MGVPRTYVSKIEGRKVTPNLSSLGRLARVFGTSVVALVSTPTDPGDKYPSEFRRRSVSPSNVTFRKEAHPSTANARP